MRRRRASALVAVTLLFPVLVACGHKGVGAAATSGPRTAVRISGSGTCIPLLRLLTTAYGPSLDFQYLPGLHSKGGIEGVLDRSLDVGAVSRAVDATESGTDVRYIPLCYDAIALAVNPSVQVDALSVQQVRDIYTGKYTDWSQLGSKKKLPIVVFDRTEDESAKIEFRAHVLGDRRRVHVTSKAIALYYEPDMVSAVSSRAGAIGYVSLGYSRSAVPPLKFLKLGGVEATPQNVAGGRYPMVRTLGIVVRTDAGPGIGRFVDWARGSRAADVMKENGYVPATR